MLKSAGKRTDTSSAIDLHWGSGGRHETTSACIPHASIRDRESAKEQALEKESERMAAVSQQQQQHQGQTQWVTPVLLSALCVFPHCTEAAPRDRTDNTLVSGLAQTPKSSHIKSIFIAQLTRLKHNCFM